LAPEAFWSWWCDERPARLSGGGSRSHLGESGRDERQLTYCCATLIRVTTGVAYRIVVRGELDERFAFLFNGMQMERLEGTTVLTGSVLDQAQLHGYIERVEELGLDLLRVEPTERGESDR
jgi:hypothetical protein